MTALNQCFLPSACLVPFWTQIKCLWLQHFAARSCTELPMVSGAIFVHLWHLLVSSQVPCFLYQKRVNTVTPYLPWPHYLWFYRPASNPLPSSHLVSSPVNTHIKAVHSNSKRRKEGKCNKDWESSSVWAVWQKRTGYLCTHEINSTLIYFSYYISKKVLLTRILPHDWQIWIILLQCTK